MLRKTRDEWVAALRSGKYNQIYGKLKNDEGYCCLGVLIDVLKPVAECGLYTDFGLDSEVTQEIMILNDTVKLPFPYLANWIEEKVPVDD